MQVTNEGYLLSRNVVKVNIKKNKFIKIVKKYKLSIIVSTVFISLMLLEVFLINSFVKLLVSL